MQEWTRRATLRRGPVGALGLAGLAGCLAPEAGVETIEQSFEDGLDPWERHAAIGPEVALEEFEWSIDRKRNPAADGFWSVRIFTEGDHDDGTAWISRSFEVQPGRSYEAEVSVAAWSDTESFNELRHLVVYLGPDAPREEEDFPDPGANSTAIEDAPYGGLREPLDQSEGWREYAFTWQSPMLTDDRLHLAVGVSVVWESDRAHYVDDVRLRLTPG